MSAERGYIHGYSNEEAARLVTQAEHLAPFVFDGVDLDGVQTLLEVGAGVGAETRLVRCRWPDVRVLAVDISLPSLRHAARLLDEDVRAGGVLLSCASATALPLGDGTADASLVCWLLEHVPDPVAVLRECARAMRRGGRLFVTEVYNTSLVVEPHQDVIERYWKALNATQRRMGGHPNIGARLPVVAAQAGLEIVSHRFVPILGDARDPRARQQHIDYFRELLRSSSPEVVHAGGFAAAELDELWAAFDRVSADPDGIICYTAAKLEARAR